MNYLLPHGGAAPATGPGWGKAEEKSQDHPPLPAAHPSRFWAGKEPGMESVAMPEPGSIHGTPGRFEVILNHSKPAPNITPDI